MYDYDKKGSLDSNGRLKVLDGFDAIAQAIENWMYVAISERIMYPEEGNNMLYYLGKKMNNDAIQSIKSKLIEGIDEDFGDYVTIQDASVIPIPEEAVIHISLVVKWRQVIRIIETNIAI